MAPWCGCDKAFHQRRNWQLRCQLPQLHPWLHIIDSYWIYLDIKRLFVGLIVTVVSSKPRAQRLDQNQIPAAISQEFCQANQHLTSTIAVGGWISRWVFSSLRSHRNDAGWNSNSLLLAAIFWEHLGCMEDAAVTTGEVEFHASYRCISHRSGAKMDLQMVPGRHIFGAFEIPSWCQSTPRRSEKGTIWHNSAVHDHRGTDAPSPMSWKKKSGKNPNCHLDYQRNRRTPRLKMVSQQKCCCKSPIKKKTVSCSHINSPFSWVHKLNQTQFYLVAHPT